MDHELEALDYGSPKLNRSSSSPVHKAIKHRTFSVGAKLDTNTGEGNDVSEAPRGPRRPRRASASVVNLENLATTYNPPGAVEEEPEEKDLGGPMSFRGVLRGEPLPASHAAWRTATPPEARAAVLSEGHVWASATRGGRMTIHVAAKSLQKETAAEVMCHLMKASPDCYGAVMQHSRLSPMHFAAANRSGGVQVMRVLCAHGAASSEDVGPDAIDSQGHTPLMEASLHNLIDNARELLALGANSDAVDKSGFSARDWAVYQNHVTLVKLFDFHQPAPLNGPIQVKCPNCGIVGRRDVAPARKDSNSKRTVMVEGKKVEISKEENKNATMAPYLFKDGKAPWMTIRTPAIATKNS